MYQEELLDHYKYPYNKQELEQSDFSSKLFNPSCGDSVTMAGHLDGTTATKICFTGKGCVISQAAASMLTQECTGKSIDDILVLTTDDMSSMIGIELGPVRMKCALLPLQALRKALNPFQTK